MHYTPFCRVSLISSLILLSPPTYSLVFQAALFPLRFLRELNVYFRNMHAACPTHIHIFLIDLSVRLQFLTFLHTKPVPSSICFLRRRSKCSHQHRCPRHVGYAVIYLVETLHYKSECCGFDSRLCHRNFSLT